jgi:hypothetical protein
MSDMSEKGTDFVRDLKDAVGRNPVSAALIGMGALWLFGGGAAIGLARGAGFDRVRDAAGNAADAAGSAFGSGVRSASDALGSVRDTVQNGTVAAFDQASRFGREQVGSVSEYARSLPESGADLMGNVRSNLTELFRAQPLALGAIGLAIGAGIAAALPATDLEAEYLGETSDALKESAQDFAAEQASRAAATAERAASAVAQEARNQGLTLEGAKAAADEISSKIGRVAQGAGKGIYEKVGIRKSDG